MAKEIYWDNLSRDIDRQLDWISDYGIEAQIWLMQRAIAKCQKRLDALATGEIQTKKKNKTRHGAGKGERS